MKKVSYTSFDYTNAKIVPVIASFDSDGHIAPLYVRLAGNACRVDSYWVKYSHGNIIEFNCKVQDEDMLKPVLLSYYQSECVWTIPG